MNEGCKYCTPEALCPEGQRLLQRKIDAAQAYGRACYSGPGGSKAGFPAAFPGSFDMMMGAARAYERHRTPNS